MAEDEEDVYRENPEFLYELSGSFDQGSYDDDLEHFPECFDENGWPLFGDYDPYTLTHPITGLVWYYEPRVPTNDETDPDYDAWFELAQNYSGSRLLGHIRAKPDVPKENPNTSNISYLASSKVAADGNLAYLRAHVLPELSELFGKRKSSPRFLLLWGEYCGLCENIGVAVTAMKRRQAGREIGRSSQSKDAQVKWYLHWRRRHINELGKAVNIANVEFKSLVDSIVEGKIKCPAGFDNAWFRKTQLGVREDNSERLSSSTWGLARALMTSNTHQAKSQLLSQKPTDEPKIPSVDLDDFK